MEKSESHEMLSEMVSEIEEDLLPELSINHTECEVCSAKASEIIEVEVVSRIERYTDSCRAHRCDGEFSFTRLVIEVNEGIPIVNDRIVDEACTSCGCEGGLSSPPDIVATSSPKEISEYPLQLKTIATTTIHVHHTSYEPEETMIVCASCHGKIHHDDEFRPDLTPEMKRKEWRNGSDE